jgi:serine phosphatase RsbU (regulator of sigma subunit)
MSDRIAGMQAMLDVVPGSVGYLTPIFDASGEPVDWLMAAVSPNAVDLTGRRAPDLIGRRVRAVYLGIQDTPILDEYRRTWITGVAATLGPFPGLRRGTGELPPGTSLLRFCRVAGGLMVSWARLDLDARAAQRLADTERMGRLGYGVWYLDGLVPGEWSENMYRIFQRSPEEGPLDYDGFLAIVDEQDRQQFDERMSALLAHGGRLEAELRVHLPDGLHHLRAVAEVVRDGTGAPTEVFGLIQDNTSLWMSTRRLVSTQRELEEQQLRLAEELSFAGRLQEIILPVPEESMPLPGLRVAVRYLPAELAGRVGGDWYHTQRLRDGSVLLAVGDVAGHGLPAAAVMAQLRHALSALTVATGDPARLLTMLNTVVCEQVSPQTLATAVVARYDPVTRRLAWAQAGHPPCLLFREGVAHRLTRPSGVILGAVPDATYRTATTQLAPGDLLLMYTDGLVEGPVETVEQGIDRLAAAVATIFPEHRDGDLVTAVVDGVPRANPHDDTCILAARAVG